jgi:adenosylcobinamide-phosphate synthase
MSFIAVLFALLLEQVRPLGTGNPVHTGMRAWVLWTSRNFDAGKSLHGWLAWGLAVGLPSLGSLAIYWLLDVFAGWPLAALWSAAVLYTTLGFRQFSFHFTQIRDALADGDEVLARRLLADWQQIDAGELPRVEIVRHVMEHSVLSAHRHVFGVLAWFSVLAAFGFGPAGAVLYRLSEFVVRYWRHKSKVNHQPVSEALLLAASHAWTVVDWVPARMTAISFAVVGSFEDAIDGWRSYSARHPGDNNGVILAATAGAVGIKLGGGANQNASSPKEGTPLEVTVRLSTDATFSQSPELAHLAVIVGLVWRTVVMWMVLLALLTLARLLG